MRVSVARNGKLVVLGAWIASALAYGNAAEFVHAVGTGVAANIQAASPMVVAGIQAETDVEVARIGADTMKYLANVASQTAMYQAAVAAQVAVAQGLAALDMFRIGEAGVNYRLNRKLTELRDARKDALKFQLTGLQKQWSFQERYLDILAIQGRNNYRIARMAMELQATAQGLSTSNFANGLTVTAPGRAIASLGATGSPSSTAAGATSPTAATRPRTPRVTTTVAAAVSRYPGRAHGGSMRGSVRPLSTHVAP